MPELIRSKLGKRIVEGLEAGAELTITEWGEELHADKDQVSRALTYLRKRGYLFYPLMSKKGKVVSILRKNSYIQETVGRHDRNFLLPHLESAFRIIRIALPKYPELHGEMEQRLVHFLNLISSTKREVHKVEAVHANN